MPLLHGIDNSGPARQPAMSELNAATPDGALTMELPVQPPDVEVPVIEFFRNGA